MTLTKQCEAETKLQDLQRLYVKRKYNLAERILFRKATFFPKIESDLHGDMQSAAEMTALSQLRNNKEERNSLSGKFRPARMA